MISENIKQEYRICEEELLKLFPYIDGNGKYLCCTCQITSANRI